MAAFTTIDAIAATVLWDVGHAMLVGSEVVQIMVLTYRTVSIGPIHKSARGYRLHRQPIHITQIVAHEISLLATHHHSVGSLLDGQTSDEMCLLGISRWALAPVSLSARRLSSTAID